MHSMQAVHLPSFPAKQFQGKSGSGPHGDFIYQMDWIVGDLMKTLDDLGVAENTIVMFGSDNGPEVPSVIAMRRDHGHDGARPWRGVKRDQWEGGHRTPFIVRWPGVGVRFPDSAGEDSFDLSAVLKGEKNEKPLRPYLLQQTFAMKLSIRQGDWKYIDHKGSGGNNYEKKNEWSMGQYAIPDTDPDAPGQLYNLKTDPGETVNLYSKHPEIVTKLKTLLEESKKSGRTD
jgi:arylsulfatase A-like enzyme